MTPELRVEYDQPASHITFDEGLFPDGSLGQAAFPGFMLGRIRPVNHTLTRPVSDKLAQWLQISNYGQLLYMPTSDFSQMHARKTSIWKEAEKFFDQAAVGSEGRLIEAVFGEYNGKPISVWAEPIREQAVSHALDAIGGGNKALLMEHFGLEGEKPHNLKEMAVARDIKKDHARRLVALALRKLRHPRVSRPLRLFSPYSENSFALVVLDATCAWDMVELFSKEKNPEIQWSSLTDSPISNMQLLDLNVPFKTLEAIKTHTKGVYSYTSSLLDFITLVDNNTIPAKFRTDIIGGLAKLQQRGSQSS